MNIWHSVQHFHFSFVTPLAEVSLSFMNQNNPKFFCYDGLATAVLGQPPSTLDRSVLSV